MTLDEAIEHCKKEAENQRSKAPTYEHAGLHYAAGGCVECAAEHDQIAEWLIELKQRREADASVTPETNGDRIRRMPDEELVESIGLSCKRCVYNTSRVSDCADQSCTEGNLKWLGLAVKIKKETGR